MSLPAPLWDGVAGLLTPQVLVPYLVPARPFSLGGADRWCLRPGYREHQEIAETPPVISADRVAEQLRQLHGALSQVAAPMAIGVVLSDRALERSVNPHHAIAGWPSGSLVLISATLRHFDLEGDDDGPPSAPWRRREWTFPELQAMLDTAGAEPGLGGMLQERDADGRQVAVIVAAT